MAKKQSSIQSYVRMVPFVQNLPAVSIGESDSDIPDGQPDPELADDEPTQDDPHSARAEHDDDVRLSSALRGAGSSDGPPPASHDEVLKQSDEFNHYRCGNTDDPGSDADWDGVNLSDSDVPEDADVGLPVAADVFMTPPRSKKRTTASYSINTSPTASTIAPTDALSRTPSSRDTHTADDGIVGADVPEEEPKPKRRRLKSKLRRQAAHAADDGIDGADVPEEEPKLKSRKLKSKLRRQAAFIIRTPTDDDIVGADAIEHVPEQKEKRNRCIVGADIGGEDAVEHGRRKKRRRLSSPIDDSISSPEPAMPPPVLVPTETVPTYLPLPLPNAPSCGRCRRPLEIEKKVQITGKCSGSFRCSACNTKGVQLSRSGKWADLQKSFKGMSKEDITGFWKSIGDKTSQGDVNKAVDDFLISRFEDTDLNSNLGYYQPLSWYKKQGYNTKKLKLHCKDKQWNDDLGVMGYRVKIKGGGQLTKNIDIREQRASKLSGGAKPEPRLQRALPPAQQVAPTEVTVADKEKVKQDRAAERVEQAQGRKKVQEAHKIVTKLGCIEVELAALMKNKVIKKLPAAFVKPAIDINATVSTMMSDAKKCIAKGGGPLAHTFAAAADVAKSASNQKVFISSLLTAASNAA